MPALATDPALLFPNPPLDSLTTTFASLALRRGLALKFPREITPFAALLENSPAALADLHSLLEPSESTFVISFEPLPTISGLTITGPYAVRQFEFPADATLPPLSPNIALDPLTCAHAAEMLDLTSIAFPGFFRVRTCAMGPYYGIRSAGGTGNSADGTRNSAGGTGNSADGTRNNAGRLVAMCGERMNIRTAAAEFREISGLCTLPDHRGRGYAPALLARLLHDHRVNNLRSYLHVAADNPTAIALYQRLGFHSRGEFPLYSIRRSVTQPL